jgi:hypothetical protein
MIKETTRRVLEGVPRVNFYQGGPRCPEDIILPSVMRAWLEFVGDQDYGCRYCLAQNPNCKIFCTYAFLVGVSGAAAFLSWKEGWHGDNIALFYMSADPLAPERRIFETIGCEYEYLPKTAGGDGEAHFRQRIIERIDAGRPVIGYGIIGPPEPALITGYDEDGDVLTGWSFFQEFPEFKGGVTFEPSGYFRKRDWFKDTGGLMLIGERTTRPSLGETYRRALSWLVTVTRRPLSNPDPQASEPYRDRHTGLAAYEAWAEHLLRDEAFPADDEATLRARYTVHNDAVGTVAEGRWYGSQFLLETTNVVDNGLSQKAMEDLLHAAALYAGEHTLMWRLWDLAGGISNPEAYRTLADPALRREMVEVIRQARDKDAQAADHLERALQ